MHLSCLENSKNASRHAAYFQMGIDETEIITLDIHINANITPVECN